MGSCLAHAAPVSLASGPLGSRPRVLFLPFVCFHESSTHAMHTFFCPPKMQQQWPYLPESSCWYVLLHLCCRFRIIGHEKSWPSVP